MIRTENNSNENKNTSIVPTVGDISAVFHKMGGWITYDMLKKDKKNVSKEELKSFIQVWISSTIQSGGKTIYLKAANTKGELLTNGAELIKTIVKTQHYTDIAEMPTRESIDGDQ